MEVKVAVGDAVGESVGVTGPGVAVTTMMMVMGVALGVAVEVRVTLGWAVVGKGTIVATVGGGSRVASGGGGDATGAAAVGVKSGGRSEGWASCSAEAAVGAGRALRAQINTARVTSIAIAPMFLRGMASSLSSIGQDAILPYGCGRSGKSSGRRTSII